MRYIGGFFPNAKIVGTTTSGEISDAVTYNRKVAISVSFFDNTELSLFYSEHKDNEPEMGAELAAAINASCSEISAIMLLASIQNINGNLFLGEFEKISEMYLYSVQVQAHTIISTIHSYSAAEKFSNTE